MSRTASGWRSSSTRRQAFTATPFYYERWDGAKYGAGETWGEMQGTRLGVMPLP